MANTKHCWKDLREYLEETGQEDSDEWIAAHENNKTCLLPDGHDSPHEWTDDAGIQIQFQ